MSMRFTPAAAFAAFVSLAGPAFAHAHLKAATPAADSTVAPPTELALTFSEGVNLRFTGVTLTSVGGTVVDTGPGAFRPGGDETLVLPLPKPLAPGRYSVEWHALATDGHKTTGHYTFTIKP